MMLNQIDKVKKLIEENNDLELINEFKILEKSMRRYISMEKHKIEEKKEKNKIIENSYTKKEVLDLLSIDYVDFSKMKEKGQLLCFKDNNNQYIPKDLFSKNVLLEGIEFIYKEYPNPFNAYQWLKQKNRTLSGFRPLELLKYGYLDKVLLALSFENDINDYVVLTNEEVKAFKTIIKSK